MPVSSQASILNFPDRDKSALIVDDSRGQRMVFARHLQGWGYRTTEAASGEEALALCAGTHFDLVLSDWMMPGISGPEFCRALRERGGEFYSYFILMTSKNDKNAVAEGLDVGADDFLTKPVAPSELRARIHAGERLLATERALRARNDELRTTLKELQQVHDALDRDLQQARKLQHSLIRDRQRDLGSCQLSFLLQSSGHVGGDLVGAFQISENRLGIFAIDVAGHGVAAAMLCARIGALFSEGAEGHNIALERDPVTGACCPVPPDQVAMRMNELMLRELDSDTYLTLCYGELDLVTGLGRLVQAGHPHPAIQRRDGSVEFIGEGGLPIGLIPQATYQTADLHLQPGDRLILYSDGITECAGPDGEEFGATRLAEALARHADLRGLQCLESLKWDLALWAGREDFGDDVSALAVELNSLRPRTHGMDPPEPAARSDIGASEARHG